MFKVKENDSFGVEISKSFAQAVIGSAVAAAGMIAGMAVIGWIIDRRKPVFLKPDQKIVPMTEPEE